MKVLERMLYSAAGLFAASAIVTGIGCSKSSTDNHITQPTPIIVPSIQIQRPIITSQSPSPQPTAGFPPSPKASEIPDQYRDFEKKLTISDDEFRAFLPDDIYPTSLRKNSEADDVRDYMQRMERQRLCFATSNLENYSRVGQLPDFRGELKYVIDLMKTNPDFICHTIFDGYDGFQVNSFVFKENDMASNAFRNLSSAVANGMTQYENSVRRVNRSFGEQSMGYLQTSKSSDGYLSGAVIFLQGNIIVAIEAEEYSDNPALDLDSVLDAAQLISSKISPSASSSK